MTTVRWRTRPLRRAIYTSSSCKYLILSETEKNEDTKNNTDCCWLQDDELAAPDRQFYVVAQRLYRLLVPVDTRRWGGTRGPMDASRRKRRGRRLPVDGAIRAQMGLCGPSIREGRATGCTPIDKTVVGNHGRPGAAPENTVAARVQGWQGHRHAS